MRQIQETHQTPSRSARVQGHAVEHEKASGWDMFKSVVCRDATPGKCFLVWLIINVATWGVYVWLWWKLDGSNDSGLADSISLTPALFVPIATTVVLSFTIVDWILSLEFVRSFLARFNTNLKSTR